MHEFAEQREEDQQRASRRGPDTPASSVVAPHETTRRMPFSASAVVALQRSVGNAATAARLTARDEEEGEAPDRGDRSPNGAPSPVHGTLQSPGNALDTATRATMERHFGEDFGDVRLHVDAHSAESVKAAAYTVGNDIVVHPKHYSPGSPAAQRTLAHELTHVVQQRSGPVDGTEAPGGIRLSDPADRFEREAEQRATTFEHVQRQNADEEHEQEGEE